MVLPTTVSGTHCDHFQHLIRTVFGFVKYIGFCKLVVLPSRYRLSVRLFRYGFIRMLQNYNCFIATGQPPKRVENGGGGG